MHLKQIYADPVQVDKFSLSRCLQNTAHDVGDLMNLETSFTDSTASHADSSPLIHPTAMLTFESECATAVASGRHRQSVDSAGGLSDRLLVGKPTELPGKPVG